MKVLASTELRRELLQRGDEPCVSIYLPLGASVDARDLAPMRLTRLIARAEIKLARHHPQVAAALLAPLRAFAERFPKLLRLKGLALFSSKSVSAIAPLDERPTELAIVAPSFHVKPLLPKLQGLGYYHLITATGSSIRLYDGDSQGLIEMTEIRPLRPTFDVKQTIAFFRDADRRLRSYVGRSAAPLVIMTDEDHWLMLRGAASFLAKRCIAPVLESPIGLVEQELHDKTWGIYEKALRAGDLRRTLRARTKRADAAHVVTELPTIARFAAEGRIDTLLLNRGLHVWGRLDPATGSLELERAEADSAVDDVLDDLAELVVQRGGKVYLQNASEMPAPSPAVALIRR